MQDKPVDKPIWVFIVGSYRSGSTTQYRLTADIVRETGSGVAIGYHTEGKLSESGNLGHDNIKKVMETAAHENIELKREQPYVVCKVFLPVFSSDCVIPKTGEPSHAVAIHKEKRMKALCTVRNPLDVITSMKRRSEGRTVEGNEGEAWDFKKVATENLPVWLGQVEEWIDLGPDITYYSHFEDFTTNLYAEATRIAAHLDIDLDPDLAKTIAKRHTIQGINDHKRRMKKMGEREDKWLPSVPGIVFGTSGNWRTWLSGPEIKMVKETNADFMHRFGYFD